MSPTINLLVSIIAVYSCTYDLYPILLIFPLQGRLITHIKQLSWFQLGTTIAVILIEFGFLLMYGPGDLSVGNVVAGVITNRILIAVGLLVLKEELSLTSRVSPYPR